MTEAETAPPPAPERLLSPAFVVIVASASAYFVSLAMHLPVLPRYVSDDLDGNGFQVGLAVGAFAVSAALVRPAVGRLGDRVGRRPLAVVGALVAGLSIVAYGLVSSIVFLVALRLVTGLGEAAYFVGAATAAQDLSPPHRRGEAASYFSIAIYSGLAVGPFLGETLYRSGGAGLVWMVSAAMALVASAAALGIPGHLGRRVGELVEGGTRRFLHPAAVMPGSVLLLGLMGFTGFTAFLALYLEGQGIDDAGPFFLLYGITVLVVRIFGARLPDRLGPVRAATLALTGIALGTAIVAVGSAAPVFYAATFVLSLGMALLYPSLFILAVERAPDHERSHAVATFSLFFDLSQGLGAPVLGVFVMLAGTDRAAFVVGALIALTGIVLARLRLPRLGAEGALASAQSSDPEPVVD